MYPILTEKKINPQRIRRITGVGWEITSSSMILHPLRIVSLLYNGSRHFTHSSPWTKFEKSIFGHSPMTRVFLACRNGSEVQKICTPSGPRIQCPAQCIRHSSISSLSSRNSMSHTLIVPSWDADIICLPSEKKATEGTRFLCPTRCTRD